MNTSNSQLGLGFPDVPDSLRDTPKALTLPDSDISFYSLFFGAEEGNTLLRELLTRTPWRQEQIRYYGKDVKLPRLTAWYGDAGATYTYSKIANDPHPWTPMLLYIESRIEPVAKAQFNSVLLNLYRNGNDAVSWHQDNESELGENPVIASLSFGGTRRFQLRHRFKKDLPRVDIDLTHGSLLIMKGVTQRFWQHQIMRTAKPVEPRINLTFRRILSGPKQNARNSRG